MLFLECNSVLWWTVVFITEAIDLNHLKKEQKRDLHHDKAASFIFKTLKLEHSRRFFLR